MRMNKPKTVYLGTRAPDPLAKIDPTKVTLSEYWDLLDRHDWYYAMSDDHSVWLSGEAYHAKLKKIAEQSPEHASLLERFAKHWWSGEPWKTERAPKPERPKQ